MQEERGPEREHEGNELIVVAVGAHYKRNVGSPEEVILHVVRVSIFNIYIPQSLQMADCFFLRKNLVITMIFIVVVLLS